MALALKYLQNNRCLRQVGLFITALKKIIGQLARDKILLSHHQLIHYELEWLFWDHMNFTIVNSGPSIEQNFRVFFTFEYLILADLPALCSAKRYFQSAAKTNVDHHLKHFSNIRHKTSNKHTFGTELINPSELRCLLAGEKTELTSE